MVTKNNSHCHKYKIINIEEGLVKGIFFFKKYENVRIYTLQCKICGNVTYREVIIPINPEGLGDF